MYNLYPVSRFALRAFLFAVLCAGMAEANAQHTQSDRTNETSADTTKGVMSGGSGNDENAAGRSSLGNTGSTRPSQHDGATKNRVPGGNRTDRKTESTVKP